MPWYNEHTQALKKAAIKMESNWKKTDLEVWRISWKDSVIAYRETARSAYFSTLLKENEHNHRYLFDSVAD